LVSQTAFVSFLSGEKVHPLMNRDSERIPRSLLRGWRANDRSIKIPYGESRQRRDCSLLQGDLQFRLLLDFFHA
jgi:hypothetical protein